MDSIGLIASTDAQDVDQPLVLVKPKERSVVTDSQPLFGWSNALQLYNVAAAGGR